MGKWISIKSRAVSECVRKDLNNASCGVLVVKFVMAIRHL
ncbi:hypothetical protein EC07798_0028 [Escherichia coli 07798]|nr:hypothetical protein ECARS42123_4891 [Escherichia coli ARS4.2123]EKI46147.1 hypothetical protein EC07798_0028 [Escherichia coli 07798]